MAAVPEVGVGLGLGPGQNQHGAAGTAVGAAVAAVHDALLGIGVGLFVGDDHGVVDRRVLHRRGHGKGDGAGLEVGGEVGDVLAVHGAGHDGVDLLHRQVVDPHRHLVDHTDGLVEARRVLEGDGAAVRRGDLVVGLRNQGAPHVDLHHLIDRLAVLGFKVELLGGAVASEGDAPAFPGSCVPEGLPGTEAVFRLVEVAGAVSRGAVDGRHRHVGCHVLGGEAALAIPADGFEGPAGLVEQGVPVADEGAAGGGEAAAELFRHHFGAGPGGVQAVADVQNGVAPVEPLGAADALPQRLRDVCLAVPAAEEAVPPPEVLHVGALVGVHPVRKLPEVQAAGEVFKGDGPLLRRIGQAGGGGHGGTGQWFPSFFAIFWAQSQQS